LKIDGGPSAGVERLRGLTEGMLPKTTDKDANAKVYVSGRILLVEDGADNQRLLRMQLTSAGGSIVSALNGRIAVDLASTEPFDLILMDMQMPIMDGYAATSELRRRGIRVPIVALTAHAMAEDRDKCLASGCDAYLSKPVDEQTLLAVVNRYLEKPVTHENAEVGSADRLPRLDADRSDGHRPGHLPSQGFRNHQHKSLPDFSAVWVNTKNLPSRDQSVTKVFVPPLRICSA
jgi:CheY-like chemotaxis protein